MKHILKKLVILQLFFATIITVSHAQTESSGKTDMRDTLFESRINGFSQKDYNRAISSMFKAYENASGQKITKGEKGKVGLKIYTNSGAGMSTPKALVDAVIEQLVKRGYKRSDINLVDISRRKMRESGFLPKLSEIKNGKPDNYDGVQVVDIESGKFFDKNWFYDNSLMPQTVRGRARSQDLYDPELRKSYLPVPLFLTVDFWINLPVVTDMEGLGVCSAIGNASIWNMSNNERFLKQPANASMAAAEVMSIPELKDSNLFTIISYERGQFVGGAIFNSRFAFSENILFMSANPVILDYLAWQTINKYRNSFRFKPIETEPPVLNYCKELKVGEYDFRKIKRIDVQPSSK